MFTPGQVILYKNGPKRGNINLTQDETMLLFSKLPEAGKVLGETIADEADALIHADLIKRGILNA